MQLTTESITLLRSAFVLYEEDVEALFKKRPMSPDTVARTRLELESIRNKLFQKPFSSPFDLNETRHLYCALKMHRECIEADLSNFSSPDRERSLSMQKSCNQLLREIRHLFLEAGVEIDKLY